MTYKVVYLVKAYSIPPTLVSSNQTEIHFVPDGGPNNKIKSSFLIFSMMHTLKNINNLKVVIYVLLKELTIQIR